MTTSKAALGAATLALVVLAARPALAQDHASCSAIELMMTKGKDPSLPDQAKPLEKKLKKPPFSSWNVFKVTSSSDFDLEGMKPKALKLAAGASTLVLRDVIEGGKRPRYKIQITMDGASGKRVFDSTVSLDSGDYIDYGELINDTDGHFVFLTCKQ
jgi:hypothetical protein